MTPQVSAQKMDQKKCNKYSPFWAIWGLCFLLIACAPPDAEVNYTVSPSSTVATGESITIDASSSTYDTLTWELNGNIYGPCQTLEQCVLSFETAGNYIVQITAIMEARPGEIGLERHESTIDIENIKLVITEASQ